MYIGWLEGRKKLSKKKIKAIQENGVVSDQTYPIKMKMKQDKNDFFLLFIFAFLNNYSISI